MFRGETARVEKLEAQVEALAGQLAVTQHYLALACRGIVELDREKQAKPPVPPGERRFTVNHAEGVDLWSVS